jgi:uncharacterized membrane protein
LFFSASLSPSLLPRNYMVQGALSGFALAVGYGHGVFAVWLWRYLELPVPGTKLRPIAERLMALVAVITAGVFLWRATIWQNSIRQLMEMEPVTSAHHWRVGLIACVLALILIAGTRLVWWNCRLIAERLNRIVPRRISYVLSIVAVGILLWSFTNGVLIKNALRLADETFEQWDALVDEGIDQPAASTASGSAVSLISWDSIGRRGKNFIVTGPSREKLSQFSGRDALPPLRVYVGLRSRDTARERAKLALEELKRVGAFDRAVLVVATPTGTGWLDPAAVDTLEFLHAGDTAIVSMQYSYLPSWLTLLIDPDRSRAAARVLFREIYGYWTTLPKDKRPKFYLHGLSLGALGSEASTELFFILDDLIHGAVWSGPPFPSTIWSAVTDGREPGSPAWLPRFRDGTLIRFTGRENALATGEENWGPMRIVYIQHASDPMTYFSPDLLFRKPDWLIGDRGPDVSPYIQWYPVISFLQIAFDLPMATSVPTGYGHNFGPSSYIDAWIVVTDPKGWDAGDIARLKNSLN